MIIGNIETDECPKINPTEELFLKTLVAGDYRCGKNSLFYSKDDLSPQSRFDVDLSDNKNDEEALKKIQLGKQLVEEVSKGNWGNFDKFVDSGCSLVQKSPEGKPLLHYLVLGNMPRKMKEIYDNRMHQHPCFNQQDAEGKTPLHCAVELKNIELVKLLILCCAKLDVQDKNGNLALHVAILKIAESKKNQDERSKNLFEDMARYLIHCDQLTQEIGYLVDIKRSKGSRREINKDGHTPLSLALENGAFFVANELAETQDFFNKKELDVLGKIKKNQKLCFFSKKEYPNLSLTQMLKKNKEYLGTRKDNEHHSVSEKNNVLPKKP